MRGAAPRLRRVAAEFNNRLQLTRGAWCWGILSCRLGGGEALVEVGPLQLKPSVMPTSVRDA